MIPPLRTSPKLEAWRGLNGKKTLAGGLFSILLRFHDGWWWLIMIHNDMEGFHGHGGTPKLMLHSGQSRSKIRLMTGGSPILGNHHLYREGLFSTIIYKCGIFCIATLDFHYKPYLIRDTFFFCPLHSSHSIDKVFELSPKSFIWAFSYMGVPKKCWIVGGHPIKIRMILGYHHLWKPPNHY